MRPVEQGTDHAPQPARVIELTSSLDDLHTLRSREANNHRQHADRLGVAPGADEQSVEPTEAHELLELPIGPIRNDDLFEGDSRGAEEHVYVVQQPLGSGGALRPRTHLVLDRYQEADAERLIARALAADAHQTVRIDVRVGRDERAMKSGWAGGLLEFHFGPRSVLSVEALRARGARLLTR
jgi:hypothetical protein